LLIVRRVRDDRSKCFRARLKRGDLSGNGLRVRQFGGPTRWLDALRHQDPTSVDLVRRDGHQVDHDPVGQQLQVADQLHQLVRRGVQDEHQAEAAIGQTASQAVGERRRIECALLVGCLDRGHDAGRSLLLQVWAENFRFQTVRRQTLQIGGIRQHLSNDRPAGFGVTGQLDLNDRQAA
jgi:hypothetical protein